jgi:hypothetical protein
MTPLDVGRLVEPEPNSGCWLWLGPLNGHGYGRIHHAGRQRQAHRVVYESHRGPIPIGLELDHLCRVRSCVNPAHLEAVSGWENRRRGNSPAALAARATQCRRGHPYVENNIYWTKQGHRICRFCAIVAARDLYNRKYRSVS